MTLSSIMTLPLKIVWWMTKNLKKFVTFMWVQKAIIVSVSFILAIILLILAFLFKPQAELVWEFISPIWSLINLWWSEFSQTSFGKNFIGFISVAAVLLVGMTFLFSGPSEEELSKNKKLQNDHAALVAGQKLQESHRKNK